MIKFAKWMFQLNSSRNYFQFLEKSMEQGGSWARKIKEADIIAKSSLDFLKTMWE